MSDGANNLLYFKRLDTLGSFEEQGRYILSNLAELWDFARQSYSREGRGAVVLDLDSATNPGNRDPRLIMGHFYLTLGEVADIRSPAVDEILGYDPETEFICIGRSKSAPSKFWHVGAAKLLSEGQE